MNAVDIILTVVIATAFIGAVVSCIRRKKSGKGCCGDCSQCGSALCGGDKSCRR